MGRELKEVGGLQKQLEVSNKMVLEVGKQLWRAKKVADSRDLFVACSLARLQEAHDKEVGDL